MGADWSFVGAENIDGVNSVIWKFTDRYGGQDSIYLSLHDENWAYYDSGDAGWMVILVMVKNLMISSIEQNLILILT